MGNSKSKPPPPPPPGLLSLPADYMAPEYQLLVAIVVGAILGALFVCTVSRATAAPKERRKSKRRSTISSKISRNNEAAQPDLEPDAPGAKKKAKVVRGAAKKVTSSEAAKAKQKTDEERTWIKKALVKYEIFGKITDEQLTLLADEAKAQFAMKNENIIVQDATEETFYVVGSGGFHVKKDGKIVTQYKAGDAFGELALLYNTPRQASVLCISDGWLWAIEGAAFRSVMQETGAKELAARAAFLASAPLLEDLTPAQRFGLAEKLESMTFAAGETVCTEGDVADSLYIVRTGSVSCVRGSDGGEVNRLKPGSVFGESALESSRAVRALTCKAHNGPLTLLRLSAITFKNQFGDLDKLVEMNFRRRVLESVVVERTRLFDKLTLEAQEELLHALQEQSFAVGELVLEQGQLHDTLYVIKSGVARVQQILGQKDPSIPGLSRSNSSTGAGARTAAKPALSRNASSASSTGSFSSRASPRMKDLAQLQPGDFFGERSLLTGEPANARVSVWRMASGAPLTCYTLDRATFAKILGSDAEVQKLLSTLVTTREGGVRVKFADLDVQRILGVGTFGRVKLAVHKQTKRPYALKCMRKQQVVEHKMLSHVLAEKRLLGMVDHPFILELVATYQDAGELYMLEAMGIGGELFTLLQKHGNLADAASRFYVASVVSMFTHLHSLKIIYRDLKPENLLLDENGFLLLVDFGMAKLLNGDDERTWTVCGTPEYMAPEVVKHKYGYSFSADWWCVGIFAFECFTGETPFTADDPMAIYRNILKCAITWPNTLQPYATLAHDFIGGLLQNDPLKRLGGKLGVSGAKQVREHPWFHASIGRDKPISWSRLERKEWTPPIKPQVSNPLDMTNFDQYDKDEGPIEYPGEYPDNKSYFADWGEIWVTAAAPAKT